jgi:hypothetical protein
MIKSLRPRGFTLRTAGAALGCVLVFSSTGLAQTQEALPRRRQSAMHSSDSYIQACSTRTTRI